MGPEHRLAVYGSLAPGGSNHGRLAGLDGAWSPGVVRGRLFQEGWGALQGYPGLRLDPVGGEIAVQVFASPDLPEHWARLDRFEGPEYRRVITKAMSQDGAVEANIYTIANPKP
jgi:gamma-glutamylcyclotransferase (GGCT)/AIG2-like uncharacterized protein YtfP